MHPGQPLPAQLIPGLPIPGPQGQQQTAQPPAPAGQLPAATAQQADQPKEDPDQDEKKPTEPAA